MTECRWAAVRTLMLFNTSKPLNYWLDRDITGHRAQLIFCKPLPLSFSQYMFSASPCFSLSLSSSLPPILFLSTYPHSFSLYNPFSLALQCFACSCPRRTLASFNATALSLKPPSHMSKNLFTGIGFCALCARGCELSFCLGLGLTDLWCVRAMPGLQRKGIRQANSPRSVQELMMKQKTSNGPNSYLLVTEFKCLT